MWMEAGRRTPLESPSEAQFRVGRVVMGTEPPPPRGSELVPYRVAFWGLVLAFLLIVLWCMRMGMSAWTGAVVFAIYLFVQGLVMARCTAEGGLLITEGCFTPMDVVTLEKCALYDGWSRRAHPLLSPAVSGSGVCHHLAFGVGAIGVRGVPAAPAGFCDERDLGRGGAMVLDAGGVAD
jgi:hypothetical protein